MNKSKVKFPLHSQKNKNIHQKTQQFSPYNKGNQRRHSQKGKQLLIPIEKLTHRQGGFRITKSLKSQGKSLEKQTHFNNNVNLNNQFKTTNILDLNSIKNSLLMKKQRQSIQLVTLSKKKVNSNRNRLVTQKPLINKQYDSVQKNHFQPNNMKSQILQNNFHNFPSANSQQKPKGLSLLLVTTNYKQSNQKKQRKTSLRKFLIKGQDSARQASNKNIIKLSQRVGEKKITLIDQSPEKYHSTQLRKTSSIKKTQQNSQKKYTQFQKQQMANYQIFYVGTRRIFSKNDFTDEEGQPKIFTGDSVMYKYEILQNLGRGSFGKVFKAFDHKKKQYVALKIIKSQLKFTNQAKIQVEILQTALLHDPKLRCNLVRMKNSFQFRGHACITFEILHKNLYEFLKQTNFAGFSQDLIRRFGIQILQTLLFFTHFRIIHCDLKPQNILLKQQNKSGIKVIDVGSGCFQSKQIYTYIQSRFYRAPQIILGIKYTSAIDIWSFGCILVQLYTGYPIFPGQNQNDQMLMFMEILGIPPYFMLQISERRRKFFNDNFQCKIPQQKGKQRVFGSLTFRQILGPCDPDFLDLISRCLQWDPKKRITPKQALVHKWIVNGLPTSIRNQHIDQINNYSIK